MSELHKIIKFSSRPEDEYTRERDSEKERKKEKKRERERETREISKIKKIKVLAKI